MTAYRDRMLAGEYDPKADKKEAAKKSKAAASRRAGRATTKSTKGLR